MNGVNAAEKRKLFHYLKNFNNLFIICLQEIHITRKDKNV